MAVKLVTEKDYSDWERYLVEDRNANFFHQIGWLKVVQATYGHKPLYLMSKNDNKVNGVLPLFFVSSWVFGRVIASDLFTSYGGVCGDSLEVKHNLMKEAAQLAVVNKASYLEIKNSENLASLGNKWETNDEYCTMILDLEPGSEGIWKNIQSKIGRRVRKAIKSDIKVERGGHLLDEFYELVALNMKRLGTPVHSKKFYQNIVQEFPDGTMIFVARVADRAIAAGLTVGFKGQCQLFISGSDEKYWHLKPNDLLHWEIIQYACDEGFQYLDFGRSTWESGTFSFKKHMGATPKPLYYNYYLNRSKAMPRINQDNKKYQLAMQLWQRLPMSVTKMLGPHLIKNIV